ncbi:hypothetical protein RM533_04940 [Croceicoccus sp. F390]|uniref:Uncharacterized protein n=1 Tax=Croceicoccus esteveae TaxID=3075597 RepID=A0ABU2ZGT4_9SPHN|nr:hypothetical protein [Croceicoccus sp. F390]MDT0575524.1 hypothetical protein [Croceicoccus sp. F390]
MTKHTEPRNDSSAKATKSTDPDELPHTDDPQKNSQLYNTAKFNSQVSPSEYPAADRKAAQVVDGPKT